MAKNSITVHILGDAKNFNRSIDGVNKKTGRFKAGLDKAARGAAVVGGALVFFGKQAFDAASKAEQAAGAVDAVFKDTADLVHDLAKRAHRTVGLATSEYERLASVFGAQLKNMGVASDELAPKTDELITLGADLAAQYGGTTAEAVESLSSLLRGERDPIEKYGVSIKQADINARLASKGLDGLTGEAKKNAELMVTLELLTEQTADAQGAFAREADTAAGAQQRANAQWENTKATLGKVLLPLVSTFSSLLQGLAGWAERNSTLFQILAAVFGGLAAAILVTKGVTVAWNAIMVIARGLTLAWQAAQWLLNSAMLANPIGLVVLAIAALVAGIILLIRHWDKVRAAMGKVWDVIKAIGRAFVGLGRLVLRAIGNVARVLFNVGWRLVKGFWDGANALLGWVLDRFRGIPGTIVRFFGNAGGWLLNVGWNLISGLWDGANNLLGWVMDRFRSIPTMIKNAFWNAGGILWGAGRDLLVGLWEGMKAGWNWLAGLWNRNIGNKGFTIPSWVPFGIGGKSFNMPNLPTFVHGGFVPGSGPVPIMAHGGEFVLSREMLRGGALGGTTSVTINAPAGTDAERVAAATRRYLRIQGTTI